MLIAVGALLLVLLVVITFIAVYVSGGGMQTLSVIFTFFSRIFSG